MLATIDITEQLHTLKQSSRRLAGLSTADIDGILCEIAGQLRADAASILEENRKDLERMDPADPKYDRLLLNPARLEALVASVENVAQLPGYVGVELESRAMPNGLSIQKISVPIGVIGIVFESRPNVTVDAFVLCFKSGNAVALKGGKEALCSNEALVRSIQTVLGKYGLAESVLLLPADRELLTRVLQATEYLDLLIPRGSESLIRYVRDHARVPVIETGAGVVHAYYDREADLKKGKAILENSKTRRVSVCNALDSLLIHRDRLGDLPVLFEGLMREKNVRVLADPEAYAALSGHYPAHLLEAADETSFGLEFLDFKMAIKTVGDPAEALEHIAHYGSRHTEVVVTENQSVAADFTKAVDAAAVYVNASTAFTDGGEFGMGAEIGISTQKLHARGPFAHRELTSYKWVVRGDGQIRS
jgi:glutamate-5-semialdehyde dehydrogenase